MPVADYFSATYREARERFLAATRRAGAISSPTSIRG